MKTLAQQMKKPRKIAKMKNIYKPKPNTFKRVTAILFTIMLIGVAGVSFYAARDYFADILKSPNSNSEDTSSSDIMSDSVTSDEVEEPEPEPEPEPLPQLATDFSGRVVPYTHLSEELYVKAVSSASAVGYDAIILDLKPDSGVLYYNSKSTYAIEYKAVDENVQELEDMVELARGYGLDVYVQISTLKDATAPNIVRENSYAYSGDNSYNWLDNSLEDGGKAWLNPYMDNTQDYILELVTEINSVGVDGIILNGLHFPEYNTYNMTVVNRDENQPLDAILTDILERSQEAVGETPIILGASPQMVVQNSENPYYVSAEQIGWQNVSVQVDYDDLIDYMEQRTDAQLEIAMDTISIAMENLVDDPTNAILIIIDGNLRNLLEHIYEPYGFNLVV